MKSIASHFKLISDEIYISELFIRNLSNIDLDFFSKGWRGKEIILTEKTLKRKFRFYSYEFVKQHLGDHIQLPPIKSILGAIHQSKNYSNQDTQVKHVQDVLLESLFNTAYNRYEKHCDFYYQNGFDLARIMRNAKTHSIIELALKLKKSNNITVESIFEAIQRLDLPDLVFRTCSLNYFQKKLRAAELHGIANAIIHKARGGKSNRLKVNKQVRNLILHYARNANKLSRRQITDQVNITLLIHPGINGGKTISRRTVSDFLRDPSNKNLIKYGRESRDYYKKNVLPYLPLENAKYPCDQFQMDGTRLQFACKDDQGNIITLVLLYILDAFSRRIMGYAVGETENAQLAIEAFRMAIRATRYHLPAEFVIDKGSAFKGDFKKVREVSAGRGVHWTISSNPRRKAKIERNILVLQTTVFNNYFGYIGEGIKSKSKNARPSDDVLLLLRDPEYLRNKNQLISLVDEMIVKYNNTSLFENDHSPIENYKMMPGKNAIRISHDDLAYMTYPCFRRKVYKSTITIRVGKRERIYNTYNPELILDTNDTFVDAYIDFESDKWAYVFRGDQYLGMFELVRRVYGTRANQTEEDLAAIKRHIKGVDQATSAIKKKRDQVDEDLRKTLKGRLPEELMNHGLDNKDELAASELKSILGNPDSHPRKVDLNDTEKTLSERKKRKDKKQRNRAPKRKGTSPKGRGSRKRLG